jgi:hypothetical protein
LDKEFKQFEQLFDSSPNIAIVNIDNGLDDIRLFLQKFVGKNKGEFTFQSIDEINSKRFRLKDRNFEYAVLSNCLNMIERKEQFINKIYHSLENSAFIILLEKKESSNITSMIELLDSCNFRAINSIDIFSSYHLVMAKKLHMWGAGQ